MWRVPTGTLSRRSSVRGDLGVGRARNHEDRRVHTRVDVAVHVHHARRGQHRGARLITRSVAAEVEAVLAGRRKYVVKDASKLGNVTVVPP